MKKILALLALSAITSAPAFAGIVFSDDFDSENGGASQLNYVDYANFDTVGAGATDLIADGGFGISCSGSCVDLDGSPGPGELLSSDSFSFNMGDFVRLSFDLSGNQRTQTTDGFFAGFAFDSSYTILDYGFNFSGTDTVVIPNTFTSDITTSSSIGGSAAFSTYSIFFTAGESGLLNFKLGSSSVDNVGPILDNVVLEIDGETTVPVSAPATWSIILGLGLVGGAMRRKYK